jgi:hypothetical protein
MKQLFLLALLNVLLCPVSFGQTFRDEQRMIDSVFSNRGEVFFQFDLNNSSEIHSLTRIISIDNVRGNRVHAYANKKEFSGFLNLGYSYKLLPPPGTLIPETELRPDSAAARSPQTIWNFYPTYQQYLDYMTGFAATYPGICKLDTVGTSIQGRLILALKISDNVNQQEAEPQFLYTSSIHGDETTGYILMLHLIDYLLTGYGSDPRITAMVDNTEIFINPLANPDGTYHGGNNSVYGAVRYNANNIDLNRNFPDPKVGAHPDGNAWQQETQAWMAFADSNHFSMSINFHGGSEVFNYPWDTWAKLTADDAWWQFVAREYVDTVHLYSPSTYLRDLDNGITNGYAWYEINGGRQDYMNYFHYCREATLEISNVKLLPTSQLINHWNYNYRSLLNYIEQAQYGFSGIVTDTVTGHPVAAKVYILGHDFDNSQVYSSLPTGFYARPIEEGTYTIGYSAPGYYSKSLKNISVSKWTTTTVNVQLKPLTFGAGEVFVNTATIYPNPCQGKFTVILPDNFSGPVTINLMTSQGVSVYKGSGRSFQGKLTEPVEPFGLTAGVYLLKITSGEKVYTGKLISRP